MSAVSAYETLARGFERNCGFRGLLTTRFGNY